MWVLLLLLFRFSNAVDQGFTLQAYDAALPELLFSQLEVECSRVFTEAKKSTNKLMHNKKTTFWYDLNEGNSNERSIIEEAIMSLYPLAYSIDAGAGADAVASIKGAEWWIQMKDSNTGAINFHYDKDEGYASLHSKMRYPKFSTITYLTSIGAPTLIFNQTTPDGNVDIPAIPDDGFISFPKLNRHVIFRGDVQHGTFLDPNQVDQMSAPSGQRITLLINWWSNKPLAPNCIRVPDGIRSIMTRAMTVAGADVAGTEIIESSLKSDRSRLPITSVSIPLLKIPTGVANITLHKITFPPGDMHFFTLPKKLFKKFHLWTHAIAGSAGKLPAAIEMPLLYRIHWRRDHVFGSVGMLNLHEDHQVNSLFNLKEPKAIIVVDPQDIVVFEYVLSIVLHLAKKYTGAVKVYVCPADHRCQDVLDAFGLPASTPLPVSLWDDTLKERKSIQPFSGNGSWNVDVCEDAGTCGGDHVVDDNAAADWQRLCGSGNFILRHHFLPYGCDHIHTHSSSEDVVRLVSLSRYLNSDTIEQFWLSQLDSRV